MFIVILPPFFFWIESECFFIFVSLLNKRWILKPDYLTACNEAGKFLEEEPFEWHGHGLNSSETISLDAPRKWRQQKQCTGHGAFYGMQIVIYGECIAPTLVRLCASVDCVSGNGNTFHYPLHSVLYFNRTH
jgi:topoisomerase (DNA) II binding protein 1